MDFFMACVRPGLQPAVVRALNVVLLLMVLVLVVLFAMGHFNLYVLVYLLLAVGLLTSVNWFLAEYQALQRGPHAATAATTVPKKAA
jgi:hypothetical protein